MNAPVTLSNVSRKNFLAYRLYSQCSLANHDGQGHSPLVHVHLGLGMAVTPGYTLMLVNSW